MARVTLSIAVLLLAAATSHAAGWKTVARDDGIQVMMREVPGRNFPTFRAIVVLDENVYDVLGVLSDIKRYPQWMARCIESRTLSRRGELEYVTYARTDAPWPVNDRDAVYRAKVQVKLAQNLIIIPFHAVKNRRVPVKDGVVRLSKLQGYYALKILGPRRTQLDYQIDVDPGGWIPVWVGKITAKRAVIDTLHAVRKQVKKTRGWYAKRIARWKKIAKRR